MVNDYSVYLKALRPKRTLINILPLFQVTIPTEYGNDYNIKKTSYLQLFSRNIKLTLIYQKKLCLQYCIKRISQMGS